MTRTCTKCLLEKPIEEFGKLKNGPDGIAYRCKPCNAAKTKSYRQRNPEKCKASTQNWIDANRERHRAAKRRYWASHRESAAASSRRWVLNNRVKVSERFRRHYRENKEYYRAKQFAFPEKAKARRLVAQALRNGKLVKPLECEVCKGRFESRYIHAHHDDYSSPLAVRWLCAQCHHDIHHLQISPQAAAGRTSHDPKRKEAD